MHVNAKGFLDGEASLPRMASALTFTMVSVLPALLHRNLDRLGDGLCGGIHQRLQGWAEGDMDIGRPEPLNGGLQGPEPFHGDNGGDLARRATSLMGHI